MSWITAFFRRSKEKLRKKGIKTGSPLSDIAERVMAGESPKEAVAGVASDIIERNDPIRKQFMQKVEALIIQWADIKTDDLYPKLMAIRAFVDALPDGETKQAWLARIDRAVEEFEKHVWMGRLELKNLLGELKGGRI
jgi:hypothetical protein